MINLRKMEFTGIAELPLHYGSVPRWLFKRMIKLAEAITIILIENFGEEKLIERLANPLWFQAFSNVLGFDWHSSGSTTVTCGVLREILNKRELGVFIAGGKGKKGLTTPKEIRQLAKKLDLNDEESEKLTRTSRLVAKIDNSALQDGYSIYHHAMIISRNRSWTIIQQGMNINENMARRYHWLSNKIKSYIEDPHNAIVDTKAKSTVLNLVAKESRNCQEAIIEIVNSGKEKVKRDLGELRRYLRKSYPLTRWIDVNIRAKSKEIIHYKPIEEIKVNWRALDQICKVKPSDFEELLLFRGIGPSTLRALALISELIYDEPPSKRDPVTHIYDPIKWSYTVGGKDGIPYPINRRQYDNVILELNKIINEMKIGEKEKLKAFQRLRLISKKWNVKLN